MRRKHVTGCVCLFAVKNKRISNEVLIFGNTIHTRLSVSSGNPPSDLKATNLDHSKSRPSRVELSGGEVDIIIEYYYLTMTTTKTPPLPQSMGGGPSFQMDPKEFEKLQALPGNLNCSE